ncbi:uncharacterized protein BX663DRAFT_526623 [Cokeromyces recurvatus]|uniref:uncharacterized protein n=1 Tax=Cokeromyces recurvatus TaxID=90255 RepID=UPI00221F0443|nr:uncharacterized protein BX663DRAFT_526623 [Cokeromyces recurvatus]KAI7897968.1 hypothetical protein BX663DRAFT_526623 [Cokeromyces recurvatus]
MNYNTTPTPSYKPLTVEETASQHKNNYYQQISSNNNDAWVVRNTTSSDNNIGLTAESSSSTNNNNDNDEIQQRHLQQLFDKKRKRRESHNAVERRRRDNINERIFELSTLLPERNAAKDHKGNILRKSVDHIRLLHEKVNQYQQRIQELERLLEMYRMRWGDLNHNNVNTTTTNLSGIQQSHHFK